MEQSPNLTINRLPDDVLLEIFDSYRQSTDQYDHQWRKKYAWFNLAHVCRRWHAVMFASSSRLDLNIVLGPVNPNHIKTILSGHLPIIIDYLFWSGSGEATGSALWRLRAALGHRDRVREISFAARGVAFRKFIRAANHHFPALESLVLRFPLDLECDIPATFLRGPDQSDLRLRRLGLSGDGSLTTFASGLLLSATALTDLTLGITTNATVFDPLQALSLLAYLKGMQCLRSLDLTTLYDSRDILSQPPPTPKDIVTLSKLTRFHYSGPSTFLNKFMSGLSAPSLQDARFELCTSSPLFYLSRVIEEVREEFRSVSVAFDGMGHFDILSSTHSGKIDHSKPSFRFNVNHAPYSIGSINSTPSTKFAAVEELAINFPSWNIMNLTRWKQIFSLRDFLRQFRSVRVLRVNPFGPFMQEVGLHLQENDDGEVILPVLEQVELSDEEYQRRAAEAMTAFQPCERAGRVVKVSHL
jgi:F-box-like